MKAWRNFRFDQILATSSYIWDPITPQVMLVAQGSCTLRRILNRKPIGFLKVNYCFLAPDIYVFNFYGSKGKFQLKFFAAIEFKPVLFPWGRLCSSIPRPQVFTATSGSYSSRGLENPLRAGVKEFVASSQTLPQQWCREWVSWGSGERGERGEEEDASGGIQYCSAIQPAGEQDCKATPRLWGEVSCRAAGGNIRPAAAVRGG